MHINYIGMNATKASYINHIWKYKVSEGFGIVREIKEGFLEGITIELRAEGQAGGNQVKKETYFRQQEQYMQRPWGTKEQSKT